MPHTDNTHIHHAHLLSLTHQSVVKDHVHVIVEMGGLVFVSIKQMAIDIEVAHIHEVSLHVKESGGRERE